MGNYVHSFHDGYDAQVPPKESVPLYQLPIDASPYHAH